MKFIRGLDIKEATGIGIRTNSHRIFMVSWPGSNGMPSKENIFETLEKYERGLYKNWSASTRDYFELKWEFFKENSFRAYSLRELSGNYILYEGRYFNIPKLDLSNEF